MKRERIWRIILGTFCLSLVFVFTSCDDDDVAVDTVDRDEAFAEFNNTTFFADRDVDNTTTFNTTEFNQGFFDAFDLNDNGFIEENELNTSRTNFRANTTSNFSALDANTDARLDMAEFQADFEANNFQTDFDADASGSVTAREFSDGVFTRFDDDNDGVIERTAFETRFDPHFR